MFEKIVTAWQEARANRLLKELEDSILRLRSYDNTVQLYVHTTVSDVYDLIIKQFGSLDNISYDGKKQLAKMYKKKAKEKFNFNLGQGYGLFFISAFLESKILPGEDARLVEQISTELLDSARNSTEDFNTKYS